MRGEVNVPYLTSSCDNKRSSGFLRLSIMRAEEVAFFYGPDHKEGMGYKFFFFFVVKRFD